MKRTLITAAAMLGAVLATFAVTIALPAGAATRHPPVVHRPALCRYLQHVRTDGTHSLRYYARKMDATGSQVLFLTGYCQSSRSLTHYPVLHYHNFARPFPAHLTLYGPF